MLNVVITDGRNDLHLAFFRGIGGYYHMLRSGRVGLFSGKVSAYHGQLQLAHPLCVMSPVGAGDDPEEIEAFLSTINPNSLTLIEGARVEPSLKDAPAEKAFQFEREGYFCADSKLSSPEHLVFNLTVALRDTWQE